MINQKNEFLNLLSRKRHCQIIMFCELELCVTAHNIYNAAQHVINCN